MTQDEMVPWRTFAAYALFAIASGLAIGYGSAYLFSMPLMQITITHNYLYQNSPVIIKNGTTQNPFESTNVTMRQVPQMLGLEAMFIMFACSLGIAEAFRYVPGWVKRRQEEDEEQGNK